MCLCIGRSSLRVGGLFSRMNIHEYKMLPKYTSKFLCKCITWYVKLEAMGFTMHKNLTWFFYFRDREVIWGAGKGGGRTEKWMRTKRLYEEHEAKPMEEE